MSELPCHRCAGCGQVADDPDNTPWSYWEQLPLKSGLAVVLGLVRPLKCPLCKGSGKISPPSYPLTGQRCQLLLNAIREVLPDLNLQPRDLVQLRAAYDALGVALAAAVELIEASRN